MDAVFTQSMPAFLASAVRCACCSLLLFSAVPVCAENDPFDGQSRSNLSSFDFKVEEEVEVMSPDAAKFDRWEPIVEDEPQEPAESLVKWNDPSVKPIDWMRHFGLHHSSTSGRYTGKGLPMEGTSWLNRPFHVDWFIGPLVIDDELNMDNEVMAGLRIGYDFDYYWGYEWRLGWAHPNFSEPNAADQPYNGNYFISDFDIKYSPWGDSKFRPYALLGGGMARINYQNDAGTEEKVTLVTMPFGIGTEWHQFPWLAWRLEILDNLTFGSDGLNTLNNLQLTAGMEWRFGARPQSYWPWRTGRKIW